MVKEFRLPESSGPAPIPGLASSAGFEPPQELAEVAGLFVTRAKEMNMVGHDNVSTDPPACAFSCIFQHSPDYLRDVISN